MGCLLVLAGLLGPRIGTLILWLSTDRMSNAYDNGWVPVLGFIFLPWTTFLYAIAAGGHGEVGTFGTVMITLGVVADVATLLGGARERRS